MKLFKGLLAIFIVTFCLSLFATSAITHTVHSLIGVDVPNFSGIYTTSYVANRIHGDSSIYDAMVLMELIV